MRFYSKESAGIIQAFKARGENKVMPGIEKLMRGVLRYRSSERLKLLKQFEAIKSNPEPTSVFFTCMDSRLIASKFTDSQAGDNFVVRSAGNLIPHSCSFSYESSTTDPGAIELGCIRNNIKHVVVCGHSDCKAMQLLYDMGDNCCKPTGSPLELFVKRHGKASLDKFMELNDANRFSGPLYFQGETEKKSFKAFIDPENKFNIHDKLSQVNCLQQLQNIASYPFLREKLANSEIHLHAMWFDIYSGEVFMFSRSKSKFIPLNEDSFDHLLTDSYHKDFDEVD